MRVIIAVLTVLLTVRSLIEYGFTAEGLIQAISPIFIFTIFQLLLKPLFSVFIRVTVKSKKKTGKPTYSPTSVIEFDEDSFTEIWLISYRCPPLKRRNSTPLLQIS